MNPSREIRDLVLGFFHDLYVGDPFELVSPRDDLVTIGTGPGEFWVGFDTFRQVWDVQTDAIGRVRIEPDAIYAFEEGTVGWASCICWVVLPNVDRLLARATLIFHREDEGWKIVHGHFSHEANNLETWGIDLDLSFEAIARQVEVDRPDLAPITSPQGTVTIMFTDIENSTATNEAMGDDGFLPVLFKHNEVVREETRARKGTIVKSQGDGYMLAFSSARHGVECAIAVQRAVEELGESIRVRMGLHTGEPVRHADDFFGRDVAYAARLGAAAAGGEILASELVRSLVEPSGSFKFEGPRHLELKGFTGVQPVFTVNWS